MDVLNSPFIKQGGYSMLVIGLTGGLGTGKSEVLKILGNLGAYTVDTDEIAHQLYEPYSSVWETIVSQFGKGILCADGKIDRFTLGKLIFSDTTSREMLNRIMHPQIYKACKREICQSKKRGIEVIVLEVPLLVEVGWVDIVDEIWLANSSYKQVMFRLQTHRKLSKEDIHGRINSQISFEDRRKYANVVINNSGTLEQLHDVVGDLWKTRVKGLTS